MHSPLDDPLVDVDLELDLFNDGLLVGVRAQRELLHLLDAANDGKRASEGLLGLVDVASTWLEEPTDEEELKELVGVLEVLEGRSGRDELGRYEVWRSRSRGEEGKESISEDWESRERRGKRARKIGRSDLAAKHNCLRKQQAGQGRTFRLELGVGLRDT